MRKYQKGFTLFELIIVGLWIFGIVGWVWNIIKIVAMTHIMHGGLNDPNIIMFILRIVGIPVAPLGVILGYIPT